MLGRCGKDAGSLLGVEIAPDSIRMLQLQRARGRNRVSAWARQALPVPLHGDWLEQPELVAALREAHAGCGSGHPRLAMALPGTQVICKRHTLPLGLCEFEQEAYLLAEAQGLFPFPLDDLALDFQVLGTARNAPDKLEVLVAACRHSTLERLSLRLEAAGLELGAVEVDSIALARAASLASSGAPSRRLLLLEADGMALHTWPDGPLPIRHARRWSGAGDSAQRLDDIQRLLAIGSPLLAGDTLLVAGGAANQAWVEAMTEHLGVACELAQPLRGLDLGAFERSQALAQASASMTLACGLALGAVR
ncbi:MULTISPECIES: type IV pilus biogenesis protein PilM [unclassified Pseudomonas]|uniref:type IV pilus biogenesis protein PilM n=1 Tax=unclassified Pseudomonas TaxID=196821 RepID=UPI0035C25531